MAGKLKPLDVERETRPGKYADGDGLYLIVKGATSKNWIYRYSKDGKERWLTKGMPPLRRLARQRCAPGKRARAAPRDVRTRQPMCTGVASNAFATAYCGRWRGSWMTKFSSGRVQASAMMRTRQRTKAPSTASKTLHRSSLWAVET
jgi:hypothetical protein